MFALLCALAQEAWADSESVTFMVRSWDATNKQVVTTTDTQNATVLEGDHSDDWEALENGYYVAKGDVTYKVLNTSGNDVHLILTDGATITVQHVKLETGKWLNIHAQSDVKETMGKLIVKDNSYEDAAGIGGGKEATSGTLSVHGGFISSTVNTYGAAIGGGNSGSCGDVYIYGGFVYAVSDKGAAAIGGGRNRGINLPNSVNIYGGTVDATSKHELGILKYGAGIGGGDDASQGGAINIFGGDVNVYCDHGGSAAIGGGQYGHGGVINISGGTVKANAGNNGSDSAGIGGGKEGNGGTITITGGVVESNGYVGIGTYNGEKGTLIITGGKVTAEANMLRPPINANITFGDVRLYHSSFNGACPYDLRQTYSSFFYDNIYEHTIVTIVPCTDHQYSNYICEYCGRIDVETATASWEGSGTAEDPWTIKSEKGFYAMNTYRAISKLTPLDDLAGKYFTVQTGTYNLAEDVQVDSRLTVSGDVKLNIAEGTTLTVPKGIELSKGNMLTIGGNGTLTINNCEDSQSGIGAYEVGTLVINSGNINVTGGYGAAALGGSQHNIDGGSITINGGVVTAIGGIYAAGIGGGWNDWAGDFGVCGNIVINGGQVTADSSADSNGDKQAGIGYGFRGNGSGSITLSWTENTDFVSATYAASAITLAKLFWLDGTTTIATIDNISGKKIVAQPDALLLYDDQNNADVLNENNGNTTDVVLLGRTLYRDGSWNTIYLPFALSEEQLAADDCPLKGATVKALTSSDFNSENGTLTLNFEDYSISSGMPYIVKWTTTGEPIEHPVFKNVKIDKDGWSASAPPYVSFKGSFSPVDFEGEP